ncbi:MAG: group 1 truncated hemoglobin [Pseudomonadota bacterium]|nr:group 1 truncated hemoglobin [Pseudomonadota bacterium]
MTPFERAGGEPVVRAIVDRFVDRQFDDSIIGFLFAGKDRDAVKLHEYEHAAASLGAPVTYTGRPIPALHRPMRINSGQFRRRLALLRQEIERAGVPADIAEAWLLSQRRMERMITDGTDCAPPAGPPPENDASGR